MRPPLTVAQARRRLRRRIARRQGRRQGITPQARAIYRGAFNGDTLPPRWHVYFVDRCYAPFSGWTWTARGTCSRCHRTIEVRRPAYNRQWLRTLIHEFIHQRCPGLRHGAEFERLVDAAYARLWG